MSSRLTIKGQVTIPKQVRDLLGLTAGSSAVEFLVESDGSVRICRADDTPDAVVRNASTSPTGAAQSCDRLLGMLLGVYA
ncbi:MAG: type II toxin-antitoxin system PrlF family antitoxin [Duodenibacillus sp.]|nr:type II toxin-antitoxin system PrlF family antitoxin [Duodenibacillus sp.]